MKTLYAALRDCLTAAGAVSVGTAVLRAADTLDGKAVSLTPPAPDDSAALHAADTPGRFQEGKAAGDTALRAVCAAFPYLAEDAAAPIARYARGKDYHAVLREAMASAVTLLRDAGFRAESMADNSPLREVSLAVSCGVGIRGVNGLVLVPGYGSWVFLGFIVTDAPFAPTAPLVPDECLGCMACLRACPTGALSVAGFDAAYCLSAVTQRRGDLTAAERLSLRETGTLWGCDRCQEVCPLNSGAGFTTIAAFREELLYDLPPELLAPLSNRTLTERFPDRAFTWRGAAVLKRNAAVLADEK